MFCYLIYSQEVFSLFNTAKSNSVFKFITLRSTSKISKNMVGNGLLIEKDYQHDLLRIELFLSAVHII